MSPTRTRGDTIFPPYAIHEFPGVDVAVVGMTLEGTPSIVTAAATANIDFHDEADSVNALVPVLKAQGIETIIVLLHEGGSAGPLNETTVNQCNNPTGTAITDVITRMDREIDLVVTGHTNWALNCPDFAGTGIMVTGAASVGRVVTDTDLVISRATKEVVSATINNVIVRRDVKPAAADLTALIDKYGTIAAPTENRVIGNAPSALTRTQNTAGESSLGDIIADAQLWATSGASWPAANGAPAVISFMNSGGIRADINVGPITYGEAFSVQPFANVLVTMDMTGTQIDALLEQQFTGGNGILQIPASLTYDRHPATAAPDRVRNIRINGVADRAGHDVPGHGEQLPRGRRRQLLGLHAVARTGSSARSTSMPSPATSRASGPSIRARRTASRWCRSGGNRFPQDRRTRASSPGSVIPRTETVRMGGATTQRTALSAYWAPRPGG